MRPLFRPHPGVPPRAPPPALKLTCLDRGSPGPAYAWTSTRSVASSALSFGLCDPRGPWPPSANFSFGMPFAASNARSRRRSRTSPPPPPPPNPNPASRPVDRSPFWAGAGGQNRGPVRRPRGLARRSMAREGVKRPGSSAGRAARLRSRRRCGAAAAAGRREARCGGCGEPGFSRLDCPWCAAREEQEAAGFGGRSRAGPEGGGGGGGPRRGAGGRRLRRRHAPSSACCGECAQASQLSGASRVSSTPTSQRAGATGPLRVGGGSLCQLRSCTGRVCPSTGRR